MSFYHSPVRDNCEYTSLQSQKTIQENCQDIKSIVMQDVKTWRKSEKKSEIFFFQYIFSRRAIVLR